MRFGPMNTAGSSTSRAKYWILLSELNISCNSSSILFKKKKVLCWQKSYSSCLVFMFGNISGHLVNECSPWYQNGSLAVRLIFCCFGLSVLCGFIAGSIVFCFFYYNFYERFTKTSEHWRK